MSDEKRKIGDGYAPNKIHFWGDSGNPINPRCPRCESPIEIASESVDGFQATCACDETPNFVIEREDSDD